MKKAIEIIAEALEVDESLLTMDKNLDEIDQWDSVGILSLMAILDELNKKGMEIGKIQGLKTVKDLVKFIEE